MPERPDGPDASAPTPDADESALLAQLRDTDPLVRARATDALWRRWFAEQGAEGLRAIERSETLVEAGDYAGAEAVLGALIERHPGFAEGYNRRAVLRFFAGRYRDALADCVEVVRRKPWHFGALQGLGLCHREVGEISAAAAAFTRVLEIAPHASREDLDACRALLN